MLAPPERDLHNDLNCDCVPGEKFAAQLDFVLGEQDLRHGE
jgi:hypothetical protein